MKVYVGVFNDVEGQMFAECVFADERSAQKWADKRNLANPLGGYGYEEAEVETDEVTDGE